MQNIAEKQAFKETTRFFLLKLSAYASSINPIKCLNSLVRNRGPIWEEIRRTSTFARKEAEKREIALHVTKPRSISLSPQIRRGARIVFFDFIFRNFVVFFFRDG